MKILREICTVKLNDNHDSNGLLQMFIDAGYKIRYISEHDCGFEFGILAEDSMAIEKNNYQFNGHTQN